MASSMREFLKSAFTQNAPLSQMAKAFSAMSARHIENGDDELASECMKASESHANAGDNAVACCKDLDAPPTGKVAGADDPLEKIVPDKISSVMSSDFIRAVPRFGSPAVADTDVSRVPEQFRKLIRMDDEL